MAANISAKLGGSLVKHAKAEANLSGSLESVESGSSTSTSREIISKTMHDAAFDIAYSHISPIRIVYGNQSADNTGNYIEMTRVFDFVDFDYLEGLFEKGGIIDFIKKIQLSKLKLKQKK